MDKISVKNIEIFANHGVFNEEKVLGQKFILSLELEIDTQEAAMNGELEKTVHYGLLTQEVIEVFKEKSIDLIETVCEEIAVYILNKFSLVKGVRVILKKPWAPISRHLDYVAIDIYRCWNDVIIGVGTNVGDKVVNINKALELINANRLSKVVEVSSYKETEPWGYLEQEKFLNAVIRVKTLLNPRLLMKELLNIENEMGRERLFKWGPRIIDLDILFFNDIITDDKEVTIPHPHIEDREFVLEGLREICPNKVHPILKKRIFKI